MNKGEHNLTIKRVSDARGSADAVALEIGCNNIRAALSEVSNSNFEEKITAMEAKSLFKKINKYDAGLDMTVIWSTILLRANHYNR